MELITYLQLLVGHGGQSSNVVGEVAGVVHVRVSVCRLVVGPHGHTLRDERQEEETEEGVRKQRLITQVLRATEAMMGKTKQSARLTTAHFVCHIQSHIDVMRSSLHVESS